MLHDAIYVCEYFLNDSTETGLTYKISNNCNEYINFYEISSACHGD